MEIDVCGVADVAAASPARRGVIVLEAAASRVLLIATTADARAFIERRFGTGTTPPDESEGSESTQQRIVPAAKTDFRGVATRIVIYPTGSAIESDLLYRELVLSRMPQAYPAMRGRYRTWWIAVNAVTSVPRWSCRSLESMAGHDGGDIQNVASFSHEETESVLTLGPFGTSTQANKAIEAIVDVFDLCRDERLLALSPNATACVYKQMGRCAAPCDGSEPLGTFRARVVEACEFVRLRGGGEWRARLEGRRRDLAARQEFEAAGAAHSLLTQADRLSTGTLHAVSSPAKFDWLLAMRGVSAQSVRVLRANLGSVQALGDYSADRVDELSRHVARHLPAATSMREACADTVGIVLGYLKRSESVASGIRCVWLGGVRGPSNEELLRLLTPGRGVPIAEDEAEHEQAAGVVA